MNDILDDVHDRIESHHYGHYLSAMCIFHDGYRPNLMIYPDIYICLSCGARGKTKNLLKSLSNIQVIQKTPDFRNPWTRWMKKLSLGQVLRSSWKTLNSNPSLGSYLENRKVPWKTQKELGIGYREDWYTFPIRSSENKIIGAVARAGEENTSSAKYIFPSEQEDMLYVPSWDRIRRRDKVYLTFGIIDAINLCQLDHAAASTTRGKKADPELFNKIQKPIIIIPDMGEEPEAHQLAKKLGWRGRVLSIDYPYGAKDINDLIVKEAYHPAQLQLKKWTEEEYLREYLGDPTK